MADPIIIGSPAFKVALGELNQAQATVAGHSAAINENLGGIRNWLQQIDASWHSPAGSTYRDLYPDLLSAAQRMADGLEQIQQRLKITYDNFVAVEAANVRDLTVQQPGGGALPGVLAPLAPIHAPQPAPHVEAGKAKPAVNARVVDPAGHQQEVLAPLAPIHAPQPAPHVDASVADPGRLLRQFDVAPTLEQAVDHGDAQS